MEQDVRSVHRGLETFAALGATTAVVRNAHHAWKVEHPQLFSHMIEGWVRDRTVTPGLDLPAERIAANRGTRR